MATLGKDGWSRFFRNHFTRFWLCGKRSGFFPPEWCDIGFGLPQLGLGLALPLLIWGRRRFPVAQQVSAEAILVPQTLVVSLAWFFIAHWFLFRLHLPNRYGEHSIRIVMALSAGVALVIIVDRVLQWLAARRFLSQLARAFLGLAGTSLVLTLLLVNPYQLEFDDEGFPIGRYFKGIYPPLYEYLAAQPKDIVVASISHEVNNLPSFTQRSILVGGGGFVLPYHTGFFQEAEERLLATISAQYAPQLPRMQKFIRDYDIDYFLVDSNFAHLGYLDSEVFWQFPLLRDRLRKRISRSEFPALHSLPPTCVVVEVNKPKAVQLFDADCILEQ